MNRVLLTFLLSFTLVIAGCGGGGGTGFGEGDAQSSAGGSPDAAPPADPDGGIDPDDVPDPIAIQIVLAGDEAGIGFDSGVLGVDDADITATDTTNLSIVLVDENNDLVSSIFTGTTTLTFLSPCLNAGRSNILSGLNNAIVPGNVVTSSATAFTVKYAPVGCVDSGGAPTYTDDIDVIVQTELAGNFLVQGSVTVDAPVVNTIGYVQPDPTSPDAPLFLGLAGSGLPLGVDVEFAVTDRGGNPVQGALVLFELEGVAGDTSITDASGITDALGMASTRVNAGTVHDSATVKATISGTTLTARSNQVWIGTGLPHQNAVSVSVCENLEGGEYDGETEEIKVILSDRFGNPVPDNTAVTFAAEGGQVEGACNISYAFDLDSSDEYSYCETTYTSANPRPTGAEALLPGAVDPETRPMRANVLVYVSGEESYTDLNGSGTYDDADDALGVGFDNLGERFIDRNEDGLHQVGELPIDANNSGNYEANNDALEGGARFNGVGCEHTSNCSTNSTTRIGKNITMVMSMSEVGEWESSQLDGVTYPIDAGDYGIWNRKRGGTFDTNNGSVLNITIPDLFMNPLPAGTEVSLLVDNGKTFGATRYTYPCTTEPVTFSFIIQPDPLTDPDYYGAAQIQIETPNGETDVINFTVYDGPPIP